MATINTIHDLIRLLRENEEWRNAVRRELLTEELLELPQRFAEYAAANDKRWERNDKRWDEWYEWRSGVDNKLDSLRGTALEAKLTRKLPPLVGREFNVARVYPISMPDAIAFGAHAQEFRDKMERAAEDGVISDDDEIRVNVTDLIIRSRRRSDRSTLWFAVEASGVINDDDVTRARRSADVIAEVYGQDAVALVYGYRIDDRQRKLADEIGGSGLPGSG